MRFRLTFITGMSLAFMLLGLVMSFTKAGGFLEKRPFFTLVGILGWFIGNELVRLEERISALEKPAAPAEKAEPVAEP